MLPLKVFEHKKKGIGQFDAKLVVDNDDIKIVTASLDKKPIFFGVLTAGTNAKKVEGQASLARAEGKLDYQTAQRWISMLLSLQRI